MTTATQQSCTCGQPTPESAYMCIDCHGQLWDALNEVPELVDELELTLTKQRRFATQTDAPRSTSDDALPFNIAASRALDRLRVLLVQLVRRSIESHVHSLDWRDRSPGESIVTMSTWLTYRVDGITQQPWAAEAMQLVDIVRHSAYVIDRPAERTFAGPCDQCGHDLYAVDGKTTVTCRDCELTYDLDERRAWLLSLVDDRLATAVEISRALTSLSLPVTAERIRQWKHRERIDVRAHDSHGSPLYRVGDVVALLIETVEKSSA